MRLLRPQFVAVAVMAAAGSARSDEQVFNVFDFGARGDGKHNDTSAIQVSISLVHFPLSRYCAWRNSPIGCTAPRRSSAAFRRTAAFGGRLVAFPPRTYLLCYST